MERRGRGRAGFTMVELIVVTVLGTLVLGAIYQVLVTNQRTYSAEEQRVRQHQNVRAAMAVLTAELREISADGGDIVAMGDDSIRIRVMRAFGVICDYTAGASPVEMTVERHGRWLEDDDSIFVFADGDEDTSRDDEWIAGLITSITTGTTCPSPNGNEAQDVKVQGLGTGSAHGPADVLVGAPVRTYKEERYTYALRQEDGEWYLAQRIGTGDPVPIAGPLLGPSDSGLVLQYRDSLGDITTTAGDVAQIEVLLRTRSEMRDASGERIQDSLRSRIYIRN